MTRHTARQPRLSEKQVAALRPIADGEVRLSCINGTITAGPVALNTLWSLEDKGLAWQYGEYSNGRVNLKLTPFGKQLLDWVELAERYESLL